jgi:hypothetical protein
MRREDILAYVNRDWAAIDRYKKRFWAEQKRRMTPTEALALADDLRVEILSRRPDWPSREQRVADWETHARVSEMLQSVRQTAHR